MAEGMLMESMMAVGAAVTVVIAVGALAYRLVAGDAQKRRLDKLKAELTKAELTKTALTKDGPQ